MGWGHAVQVGGWAGEGPKDDGSRADDRRTVKGQKGPRVTPSRDSSSRHRVDSGTVRCEKMSRRKTVFWWEKIMGLGSDLLSCWWLADTPEDRSRAHFS